MKDLQSKIKSMVPVIWFEIFSAAGFLEAAHDVIVFFRSCWQKSKDGYVNQGDDPRIFGRIGAFVQWLLSFNPKQFKKNPYAVIKETDQIFVGNPPYIAINIRLNNAADGSQRWAHCRIGWRYDVNWTSTGGYIADAALKVIDHKLIYK